MIDRCYLGLEYLSLIFCYYQIVSVCKHFLQGDDGSKQVCGNYMVIVFIDMLGVRDKWAKKGREGAEDAFKRFRNLIAHSIRCIPPNEIADGFIESDSAIIICKTTTYALELAKKIYTDVFNQTSNNENNRIWLRGVIIPQKDGPILRREKSFNKPYDHVKIMLYNNDLFDAIALEKSGFKGMRILVDKDLVTETILSEWVLKIEHLNFITLKKLRNSSYPKNLDNKYVDFLWMATISDEVNKDQERVMALRLRKSAESSEEFLHAAATQLLFHEYIAMLGTIKERVFHYNRKKQKKLD